MSNLRKSTHRLFQSALAFVCFGFLSLASLQTFAKPQLVTPQLPPAIQGQVYAASLVIGNPASRRTETTLSQATS